MESDDDNWDIDDKALEAAKMEAQVFGGPNGEGETKPQTLRRLFEENSATAAMRIIELSSRAHSERIRLDASKYIVERVLGPLGQANDAGAPGSIEHALEQMQKNMNS